MAWSAEKSKLATEIFIDVIAKDLKSYSDLLTDNVKILFQVLNPNWKPPCEETIQKRMSAKKVALTTTVIADLKQTFGVTRPWTTL